MLLAICVILVIQLSISQAAEIIPRPDAAENKLADAAAPEAVAAPVDVPAKNVGELLGSNTPEKAVNVNSPEALGGILVCW